MQIYKTVCLPILLIITSVILFSCGSGKSSATDTVVDTSDSYHADNDIVMTLRSLIDAISVGEEIKGSDYDFTGVLTDGVGKPLYTSTEGMPGEWRIKVVSPGEVDIYNTTSGDLELPQLREYILRGTVLTEDDRVDIQSPDADSPEIYEFKGGVMQIGQSPGNDASKVEIVIKATQE